MRAQQVRSYAMFGSARVCFSLRCTVGQRTCQVCNTSCSGDFCKTCKRDVAADYAQKKFQETMVTSEFGSALLHCKSVASVEGHAGKALEDVALAVRGRVFLLTRI
jgi:hypothetical protein